MLELLLPTHSGQNPIPNRLKEPPSHPLPSQPQRDGPGSPSAFPTLGTRIDRGAPALEGPQLVLPLRLQEGVEKRRGWGWDCGRALPGPLCCAKCFPPTPCKQQCPPLPDQDTAWSIRHPLVVGFRLSPSPAFSWSKSLPLPFLHSGLCPLPFLSQSLLLPSPQAPTSTPQSVSSFPVVCAPLPHQY